MTKRIASNVLSGEIDNTVEGRVTGRLWLWGMDQSVGLELAGDCWRDLAGRKFRFENPNPQPQKSLLIGPEQRGVIGDVTMQPGWLKREGEMENDESEGIYFEWFSESDGRVVIELAEVVAVCGPPEWPMDESAEGVQRFANAHALRDYLAEFMRRQAGEASLDDEYASLAREVEMKFEDYPNAASMVAFVLGRDDELEDQAKAADDLSAVDSPHGICQEAENLAVRAIHLAGSYPDPEGENEDAVGDLFYHLGEMASQLALLFDCAAPVKNEMPTEVDGWALLGRCFECYENAMGACCELIQRAKGDAEHERELEDLRDEMGIMHEKLLALKKQWLEM